MVMTNWKEAVKGIGILFVGSAGGVAQTVAPVLAGTYDSGVVNFLLTGLFVVLTAIGIKEVNKSYAEEDLDI